MKSDVLKEELHLFDPELDRIIKTEAELQSSTLPMNASENIVSKAVREACGSVFANRVAEGLPGKRYHSHCKFAEELEQVAVQRAKSMSGGKLHVNIQPHSGTNANFAVFKGLLKPGAKILSMKLSHGGHLSHGSKANFSGQFYSIKSYSVSRETNCLDYDEIADLADAFKPDLLIAGASSYPRKIEFPKIAKVAQAVGAIFMVDAAHILGLIVAGLHPSPFKCADVITSSTQKTLPGPRGGIIFCKPELANRVDRGVFPGTISDPHMHTIAGKAVVFKEAMTNEFAEYQKCVINNCQVLAKELSERGFNIVTGGTDNHLLLVDLTEKPISGRRAQAILDDCGISSNMNLLPYDSAPVESPSGLRLGTPGITRLGCCIEDVIGIAKWIADALNNPDDDKLHGTIRRSVMELRQALHNR